MDQMKKTDQNSRKRTKKMEISNLSDAELKTLVIRMLKELSEGLSSTKRSHEKQRIH